MQPNLKVGQLVRVKPEARVPFGSDEKEVRMYYPYKWHVAIVTRDFYLEHREARCEVYVRFPSGLERTIIPSILEVLTR